MGEERSNRLEPRGHGRILTDSNFKQQFQSHSFAISPHVFARVLLFVLPLKNSEGAGNAGRTMRPQPCVQSDESTQA
jgi:hypothetical protein